MKVLVVSQYYPPEMAAGGIRVAETVSRWTGEQREVHVLTALPNYPDGNVPEEYRRLYVSERGDGGEHVHRVPLIPSGSDNLVLRALKFVSFMMSAVVFGLVSRVDPDVIMATSPPPTAGVAGAVLAAASGTPFVLDVRDLWPETVTEVSSVPAPVVRALDLVASWLYARADEVVVVSRAFEDRIRESRRSRNSSSPAFIPNGVDLDQFSVGEIDRRAVRAEYDLPQDGLLLTYVGTFGLCQDLQRLETAYRAFDGTDVHTCLVGGGAQHDVLANMASDIRSLTVLGRQPRSAVPRLYGASDAGLVVLRDTPVMETVIPSKVFEIMASGLPVLLVGGGEVRRLVEETGCGLYVDANDLSGFVNAAKRMGDPEFRRELGEAGRKAVERTYNRDSLSEKYLHLLEAQVGNREEGSPRETSGSLPAEAR